MGRIRILPENLTNKIAAGEVVERPASVVKELVENSVDAGAAEVVVDIENGGKKLIKVIDTGSGMTREDALLALERHATSKIRTDDDLFSLTTLGFRGEALPSVASVSRFTLATRPRGAIEGTEIYLEGGTVREVKACGMAEGTVVTVRNLFFNTPARLKFLKSVETEAGHVGDVVTRMALSRPDVRVTYRVDGKTVFRALNGSLLDRITTLLGRNLAGSLFPVEYESAAVRVSGFVAAPEVARSASTQMFTFVNGRFVRDKVVQHAVTSAYRQVLEKGRYPVVVLFLDVPAGEVDVNVHPTKHEVRFRRQGDVHDGIVAAVEAVVRSAPWQRKLGGNSRSSVPSPGTIQAVESTAPPVAKDIAEDRVASVKEALLRYRPEPERTLSFPPPRPDSTPAGATVSVASVPAVPAAFADPRPPVTGYFSSLTVIGQFHSAYIVCEDGDDLVLIDQHAAHERVAFERLRRDLAGTGVETQGLLFPETVELSFGEAAVVAAHAGDLLRIGFGVEHFGGTTYILQAIPRLLANGAYLQAFRDIVEELADVGRNRRFDELAEEVLARVACHSVVRGRHSLSLPEIRALFAAMDDVDFSGTCPHGRPVSRKLSLREIEKMFKRQ